MTTPSRSASARRPRRVVVIGGGLTGMLTAAVLAERCDEVVIAERDVLPTTPAPRRGLPQAPHAHVLWSGGARAIDNILPGIIDEWIAAGARRIPLPGGLVSMTPQGWFRRWPTELQFLISCSRDLLDWCIRKRVLAHPAVRVREQVTVTALLGSAARVTGVRLHDRSPHAGSTEGAESTGRVEDLAADLVVDAGGRGTRAVSWLADLGVTGIQEAEVDSGVAYATRIYAAPAGTENYPLVNVQPRANTGRPGRGTIIAPIEGGRWLVTLSGTRGGEPTKDPAAFEAFARSVRHPIVGELITHTTPLSDEILVTRSTLNRRRFYERNALPDGFIALGDAVATYNPVYGHGMSVAALSALALRTELRRHGLHSPGLARRVQREVATPTDMAWQMATGQDILYPGATGTQPKALDRVAQKYIDRLTLTATARPYATRALLDVMTLSAPATTLFRPTVVLTALRGPRRSALAQPPLTVAERSLVASPPVEVP
ncbi:NAD(P)/FAD-dependent oxidoreductase [Streptomyces sp. NBC_01304]|uniref:NAD(P)/FAD-dependent oxidoreductase n=1 Tax=Streptomyces sp. NBC_01304 TaxID=2903818 RepID=UPI002E159F15|nr:pyridine nucleotide-disulfide oxidoreductase [Streptomyces sp. NBC_01304]